MAHWRKQEDPERVQPFNSHGWNPWLRWSLVWLPVTLESLSRFLREVELFSIGLTMPIFTSMIFSVFNLIFTFSLMKRWPKIKAVQSYFKLWLRVGAAILFRVHNLIFGRSLRAKKEWISLNPSGANSFFDALHGLPKSLSFEGRSSTEGDFTWITAFEFIWSAGFATPVGGWMWTAPHCHAGLKRADFSGQP